MLPEGSLPTPPPGLSAPPPGLCAPPGLGQPTPDTKRERTLSAELSEQSTASGSPASSPGPSPKPMYSMQELLRFRLPAEAAETPILYSTMSIKDLEAPKSPSSAKKEKRGRVGSGDSNKARAGAKAATKPKVAEKSWR
jgi:hypothetical protein